MAGVEAPVATPSKKGGKREAELRKEVKSLRDRNRLLEAELSGLDPLASVEAFLAAVRVEHARTCSEVDRLRYPLAPMMLGPDFLESLRELEGIDPRKVVEVCARVAEGRAHLMSGREVHEYSVSRGGPTRTRADGAKAMRCALQVGSPSARRLHYWVIPGKNGFSIEFINVAVHDDV